MSRAGGPKLGWLSTLNASTRNSRVARTAERRSASRARGRGSCSPARAPRPPGSCRTCPSGAAAKRVDVEPADRATDRAGFQSPTQLGRSDPRSPCSDRARPSVTVIGRPERAWKMPAEPPAAEQRVGDAATSRCRSRVPGRSAARRSPRGPGCGGRRGTPGPTRPRDRRCSASRRLRSRWSRPAGRCRRTRRRSRGCWCVPLASVYDARNSTPWKRAGARSPAASGSGCRRARRSSRWS